jgi:hypothetical protein
VCVCISPTQSVAKLFRIRHGSQCRALHASVNVAQMKSKGNNVFLFFPRKQNKNESKKLNLCLCARIKFD